MKKHLPWIIFAVLVLIFIAVLPSSVTIVPIAQVEARQQSEKFDPVAYVDGIWESRLVPDVQEKAVDLAAILGQIEVDANGKAKKEQLVEIAKANGLITVGEAHVYMVKGKGEIVAVDDTSRVGTLTLKVQGYDGPITVKLYIGPRIPSDETAVRDAVGFVNFGDFRDQTEFGKVASEINKRVANQVLGGLDKTSLEGKTITFYGAMSVRTFNLPEIDMHEIVIVPIVVEVSE